MHGPTKRLLTVLLFLAVGGQILLWTLSDYDPIESTLDRAKARLEMGDISKPLGLVRHLTERYPERADAWAALAEVDAHVGGMACVAEARAAIVTALACHDTPEHLRSARRVQGLLLMLEGDAEGGTRMLAAAATDGDATAARAQALLALCQGGPDAVSRLRMAAEAVPGDDALAAALASADAAHADAEVAADPPEEDDAGGWPLYAHARLDAALGHDHRAAVLLMRARERLGSGRLADQLPLARAALLIDAVFAHAGPETAAVVQHWPERAPWQDAAAAASRAAR
jgi:hypothetical protein